MEKILYSTLQNKTYLHKKNKYNIYIKKFYEEKKQKKKKIRKINKIKRQKKNTVNIINKMN